MPDITNAQDYAEYKQSVAEFIAREQIKFLSTGGDDPDAEPWFSWRPCECCGTHLGGNRELLWGISEETNKAQSYNICEDCVYYVNYGRLDDQTMLRVEQSTQQA